MSESHTVIARITPAPGQEDALEAAMKELVQAIRAEAGCIQYDFYRTTEDPCIFVFYEIWETKAHWEAHMTGEALWGFNQKAGAMIEDAEILPLARIA